MFNRYTSKQTYRTVPPSLGTPEEARRTVETAEADFEARLVALSAAVSRECAEDGIRILRLTGPTCSGKTTAAGKLTEALEAAGLSVYPISLDDFYLDRQELEERARARGGTPDYDSADTLDLGAMEACVRELRGTGETDIPVFNFTTGNRAGTRHLAVPAEEKPVFLFEGIQALYPPVTALFADIPSRSVYISALHGLEVAGEIFPPVELRLLRRLVRDEAVRDATPAFTLALWESVRANEETSILPFANGCDYLIDSAMPFELHMLKPYLERLFRDYPVTGRHAVRAEHILASLRVVEGIPSAYLPAGALYREFIPMCLETDR